jgi:hypothetical protein
MGAIGLDGAIDVKEGIPRVLATSLIRPENKTS